MSRDIGIYGWNAAGGSGELFRTRTDPGQITAAQLAAGAFLVLGAGMALVNLVWLAITGDLTRLWFVVGGAVVAAGSGWLLRLLRQRQRAELTIALSGVTYVTNGRSRSWAWRDLTALALGDGVGGRLLIIEDRQAARADRQATGAFWERLPRLDAIHPAIANASPRAIARWVANASPLATLIPLRYLEADEIDIVDAIQRFSRGRFPDPERRGPRVPDARS